MNLGEPRQINEDTLSSIKEFIYILYENKWVKSVNELKSKYGGEDETPNISGNFHLSALPFCTDTQRKHLNHVINQVGIWKRVHIAKLDMPQPVNTYEWSHSKNDEIMPHKTGGEIMLVLLVDVLEKFECESGNNNEDDLGDLNDNDIWDKDYEEDFEANDN